MSQPHKYRELLSIAARYVLGAAILYWLLTTDLIDLKALHEVTAQVAVISLILVAAQLLFAGIRVKMLLASQNIHVGIGRCIAYNSVGIFYSLFLPGGMSGDLARAYCFWRAYPQASKSALFGALFLDRLLGTVAMLLMGLIAGTLYITTLGLEKFVGLAWLGFFGFIAAYFLLMRLHCKGDKTADGILGRLLRFIEKIDLQHYGARTIAISSLLSFAGHFCAVLIIYLLSQLMMSGLHLLQVITVAPIGLLANALPLTPGGIGIGEKGFDMLYRLVGGTQGGNSFLASRIFLFAPAILGAIIVGYKFLCTNRTFLKKNLKDTNWFSKLTAVFAAIAICCAANAAIYFTNLPSYGLWTGIRPLEGKLKKLETFAAQGPVDAIALGSSISDFGFSAELYSKLMSEKLGRPYRVFNFSSGGVELVTIPNLYRIARSVAKPKAIFLVAPAQIKRGEELHPQSPDVTLSNAPIGKVITNPTLLQLSKFMYSIPIIEKSAAMRDLMLYRAYRNLKSEGMDTYEVTSYGDRISYVAGQATLEHMYRLRKIYEAQVRPVEKPPEQDLAAAQTHFLPNIDIKALEELRTLAQQDGVKIYVLAHSSAAPIWLKPTQNIDYQKGRVHYYETLAKTLDATLLNPIDGFSVPDYADMEDTHINTYGARLYTRAAFNHAVSLMDGKQTLPEKEQPTIAPKLRIKEPTFGIWSAVIMREPGQSHTALRCRFVENFSVPAFPPQDLFFAVRMPDGRDVIAPAKKLKNGEYEADIPLEKTDKTETLIFRLLYGEKTKTPLSAPLAYYTWIPAT